MPRSLLLLLLAVLLSSCVIDDDERDDDDIEVPTEEVDGAITIPPRGEPGRLDVGAWNIEFFGSTSNGPTNEAQQLALARDVILGADLDLWAVEEIVSRTQFNQLVAQMPGYAGLLANDASVVNGSAFYSSAEQKVGIIFKTSVVTVRSARLILTNENFNFAGRPPLEVSLTVTINGATSDLVFIALHAKALGDSASYNRRLGASAALKTFLDTQRGGDRVIVAGDFNDDLDVSTSGGRVSPYQNFVSDSARYLFPTREFTDNNQRTTVNGSQPIDHHLITNELAPLYVADSAEVYRVDQFIPDYGETTSDHFPILTKYALGGGGTPPRLIINEILANEPGSSVAGEFIEIVNTGGSPASLGGFTVSDSTGVRHVFATGTSVAAGRAVVVFSAASGIPTGVTAVAASSGQLGFNNTGDTVTLANSTGAVLDRFAYTPDLTGVDGVSMNRNPDATAGAAFVLHTAVGTLSASPGRRANGSAF